MSERETDKTKDKTHDEEKYSNNIFNPICTLIEQHGTHTAVNDRMRRCYGKKYG